MRIAYNAFWEFTPRKETYSTMKGIRPLDNNEIKLSYERGDGSDYIF